MDRKAIARETLDILKKGYYEIGGKRIEIKEIHENSVKNSFLLSPEQGKQYLAAYQGNSQKEPIKTVVWNCSTVEAIIKLAAEKKEAGVLNFASAKNPGGGFLNGAMAQEESLAASGGLYETLTVQEEYYRENRVCGTMMYTNYAIYSPKVVFFRDQGFRLIENPVTADVLTLPAVNMGQVLLKGEDKEIAEQVMKLRMKLALAIFAEQGCRNLILGAYGCGVFRNDPEKIAVWWKELSEKYFANQFETIVYAVLDQSSEKRCINTFLKIFEN